MGKIKVASLGGQEEQKMRDQRKIKREEKKKRESADRRSQKVHISGMKGGERIKAVGSDEDIEKLAKIAEEVEKDQAEGIVGAPKKEESADRRTKKIKVRIRSKRYKEALVKVDPTKKYSFSDAVKLLRDISLTKFDPSVELHINTEEKGLRGMVAYPHGTGRKVRVAIADDAMITDIEKGILNFEILIAHPQLMRRLAKVARILGPKGLMPNPKNGTISEDPEKAAAKFQKGEISWKTESDFPIIHQVIGKLSFKDKQLEENCEALVKSIGEVKIISITLKSTMSPAIKVQV